MSLLGVAPGYGALVGLLLVYFAFGQYGFYQVRGIVRAIGGGVDGFTK